MRSLKNVTVPVSQDIPPVRALVEVRYLYAWSTGGLAQPVLLGIRTDADKSDAKASQLKFKSE
jgi:bifunctional non-homologous end joining protein LigD